MSNIGNPYTKNGRFCSKEEADRVRYEVANKKEAELAKQQDDVRAEAYNPKDMRNAEIKVRTIMPSTYKKTSEEYYNKIKDVLNSNDDIIKSLNTDDVKAVIQTAKSLLKEAGHIGEKPACYLVASSVSAILDKKNIQHKIYAGVAGTGTPFIDKTSDKTRLPSNHVWVITNKGKIYESFEGQKDNIPHYSITDELVFKKGER